MSEPLFSVANLHARYGSLSVLHGVNARIEIGERVNIPDALIPEDARVEMDAKMAAGYFTPGAVPDADELKKAKGRGLDA